MKKTLCFCLLLLMAGSVRAQEKTPPAALDRFMDHRFGLFIHWGPVALRGTEIGWSRGTSVPVGDYDNLYEEFNPTLFNAENWVLAAKNAGVKYLTITAKHHDGFCLWPTKTMNYSIAHSPFKRDVVGELAAACRKHGIHFCIYFTVLDWHDPDYPVHLPDGKGIDPKSDMKRFVGRMKAQLKELVTNYHPEMLWFDGNWESPWTEDLGKDIYAYLKSLDKNVVINNRLGKGKHPELGNGTVGDYATPEQFVGAYNPGIPWESCITICQQWAWKPNDKLKSTDECLKTLVKTVAGGGNLLFNVGPMLDGRIEQRQVDRLAEMGAWLKKYGEAVYGTRAGLKAPDSVWASTVKGNKVYVFVLDPKARKIVLPAGVKVRRAGFIGGAAVTLGEESGAPVLTLPAQLPDPVCSVIELER
ncbi:alpha-L-fucosidase [Siphonobacter aquaeclarae]|uniref:alpha-L-fucosidase n=1 Tax=Siphonobacter aquaeclarae TaxID=563176 RepID=A0A1G9HE52_9BACT|nr:alpha-L-fucosidase [Siphonobacter aquaeclarae]SDL11116.1 alpha-L-fucosidase [Siphonobacter aquaeclarae]